MRYQQESPTTWPGNGGASVTFFGVYASGSETCESGGYGELL
jgi:hypothetical protein